MYRIKCKLVDPKQKTFINGESITMLSGAKFLEFDIPDLKKFLENVSAVIKVEQFSEINLVTKK